jgi:hypothetical protein
MKNNTVKENHLTPVEKLIKDVFQKRNVFSEQKKQLPEILVITTFPPCDSEIANYAQKLIKSLKAKLHTLFEIKICALNVSNEQHDYGNAVDYILNVEAVNSFKELAQMINNDDNIRIILIEHEFGFFNNKEEELIKFLKKLDKSVLITFHTVLSKPDASLQQNVQELTNASDGIIVKNNSYQNILVNDYQIPKDKISVITH